VKVSVLSGSLKGGILKAYAHKAAFVLGVHEDLVLPVAVIIFLIFQFRHRTKGNLS
jgi:hypothetical protein